MAFSVENIFEVESEAIKPTPPFTLIVAKPWS